jgi:glycosyltransferase involved in cell wall biosynthesis
MRIALIAKAGHADSGVGRYTQEFSKALTERGHDIQLVHPVCPLPSWFVRLLQRLLHWDIQAFFDNYPVWARYPAADIYHITSQNLATLMIFRRPPGETVITVHDIIPWLVRADPQLRIYDHCLSEWFDRLALKGLRRADGLIADSCFTQESLAHANLVAVEATVVMLGVD